MRNHRPLTGISVAVCMLLWNSGCGEDRPSASSNGKPKGGDRAGAHAEHHCEEGPHGGQLVELGSEYHAEVVTDEKSKSIVVYLLDEQAKGPVPAENESVVLNALVDSKPQQHRLTAEAQTGDAAGKSSRFRLSDETLLAAMLAGNAEARLNVQIEGRQYTGEIEHCDHEHGDHEHGDHERGEHEHGDHEHGEHKDAAHAKDADHP